MRSAPIVRDLAATPGTPCPCGTAYRMLTGGDYRHLSVHVVEVAGAAERHYHTRLTECYFVLDGEGRLEMDDEAVPLMPGRLVVIPPGTRHRAVGRLRLVNIVVPAFDPEDEHLASP